MLNDTSRFNQIPFFPPLSKGSCEKIHFSKNSQLQLFDFLEAEFATFDDFGIFSHLQGDERGFFFGARGQKCLPVAHFKLRNLGICVCWFMDSGLIGSFAITSRPRSSRHCRRLRAWKKSFSPCTLTGSSLFGR